LSTNLVITNRRPELRKGRAPFTGLGNMPPLASMGTPRTAERQAPRLVTRYRDCGSRVATRR